MKSGSVGVPSGVVQTVRSAVIAVLVGAVGAAPQPPAFASETRKRLVVVVFDDAHLSAAGFKRSQDAALALFSKHFLDGDVGAVVIRRQMVNNRLTSDRNELVKAVKDAKPDSRVN